MPCLSRRAPIAALDGHAPLPVPAVAAASGGTVVLPEIDTPVEREREYDDDQTPQYHVVLLDDDDHTYDYVVEMLQTLFLMTEGEAFQRAVEVDTHGRSIVMTCDLAAAGFARDQIHAYGPDWRMPRSKGSMSAVLEPVGPGPKLK